MANINFKTSACRRLSGIEELRAYAHPTRMAILTVLTGRALTLSHVARRMEVHPANLSRHFKMLERAGLIVLVEKRDTGKNLEKYYRAAAASFVPDFEGLNPADKRKMALGILRDELSAAILRAQSGELAESDMLVFLSGARLHPKDLTAFHRKLAGLVKEFSARDVPDGRAYALGLSLFPAVHHPEDAGKIR
ncbi:MAG: helix-turn-helix transcriptional regulator, partial [Candidatus Aminicenantes bacterium]|nr:helix-turn-helix transcriptional regulator [Candidatus Aminicenantes bacterium]